MIAPDGSSWDIPMSKAQAAVQAGGKVGVWMKGPDGGTYVIPHERAKDAIDAGGVPFQSYAALKQAEALDAGKNNREGFWKAAGKDALSLATGMLGAPFQNPATASVQMAARVPEMVLEDQARKQAGYSGLYRAAAPVAR